MTALHVTFRVGTADYALPAAAVLHLESFVSATHVPGAPPYVAGLVQVRGRLVPVVDLRKRFGLGPIEHSIDRHFHPYWGSLLKESNDRSSFGDQVEEYACLYTSRVSNLMAYSPLQHYRSAHDRMPHEL